MWWDGQLTQAYIPWAKHIILRRPLQTTIQPKSWHVQEFFSRVRLDTSTRQTDSVRAHSAKTEAGLRLCCMIISPLIVLQGPVLPAPKPLDQALQQLFQVPPAPDLRQEWLEGAVSDDLSTESASPWEAVEEGLAVDQDGVAVLPLESMQTTLQPFLGAPPATVDNWSVLGKGSGEEQQEEVAYVPSAVRPVRGDLSNSAAKVRPLSDLGEPSPLLGHHPPI